MLKRSSRRSEAENLYCLRRRHEIRFRRGRHGHGRQPRHTARQVLRQARFDIAP